MRRPAGPREWRYLPGQFAGRGGRVRAAAPGARRLRPSRGNGRPFVALSLHPGPQVPE